MAGLLTASEFKVKFTAISDLSVFKIWLLYLFGDLGSLRGLASQSRSHSCGDLSHFSYECEAVTEDVWTVEAVSRLI